MSKKKECGFKEDIEKAERNLLIMSWLGVVSAIGIIIYSIAGI